jgi:UDP-3-O-acyl N-acetylglucosamine deacetylase
MIKQKTIKDTVTIEGLGLQTGVKTTLTLKSSPANSGINFIRTDLVNKPLLSLGSISLNGAASPERRTTLVMGPLQIQTTEHFLASLSGLGIDNIVAELSGAELPGLDGSAKIFAETIKRAGIIEQDAQKKIKKIEEALWVKGDDSIIVALPHNGFKVSYTLSYDNSFLGDQFFSTVVDEKSFMADIAPARTFCLEAEAIELLKRGLGKGANYDNTLVIGKDGPKGSALRFPNEPVRHKVLDLIGDLYVLGFGLEAHIIAVKSGHKLNMELVKKIKETGN